MFGVTSRKWSKKGQTIFFINIGMRWLHSFCGPLVAHFGPLKIGLFFMPLSFHIKKFDVFKKLRYQTIICLQSNNIQILAYPIINASTLSRTLPTPIWNVAQLDMKMHNKTNFMSSMSAVLSSRLHKMFKLCTNLCKIKFNFRQFQA